MRVWDSKVLGVRYTQVSSSGRKGGDCNDIQSTGDSKGNEHQ